MADPKKPPHPTPTQLRHINTHTIPPCNRTVHVENRLPLILHVYPVTLKHGRLLSLYWPTSVVFMVRVIGDSKPITTSTRQAQTAGALQPIGVVLRRARPEVVAMVTQGAACMADDAGVMDYSNGMGCVKGGWG
ncbi:hypothetical protein SRHO_G00201670 [Serrasalmus rhombeus]